MTVSAVKARLRELGIRPSKSLGQHFLLDGEVAHRLVEWASLAPQETVLEVGPGLGLLTAALVDTGAHVVAVEKDPRLCRYLRAAFPTVTLLEGDVLHTELPPFHRTVSNLPYEISSPFTLALLTRTFRRAILTYQREFATRLVADPGTKAYGRITAKAYLRCRATLKTVLPPEAFWPPPAVESAVVQLEPRSPPFEVDPEAYDAVTDALFRHRRKKVANALLLAWQTLADSRDRLRREVAATEYADLRPEALSPSDLARLTNNLTLKVKRRPLHGSDSGSLDGASEDPP